MVDLKIKWVGMDLYYKPFEMNFFFLGVLVACYLLIGSIFDACYLIQGMT
jgi:hypothetical protein